MYFNMPFGKWLVGMTRHDSRMMSKRSLNKTHAHGTEDEQIYAVGPNGSGRGTWKMSGIDVSGWIETESRSNRRVSRTLMLCSTPPKT